MKTKSIKVMRNIWGNYIGFIGSSRSYESGNEFDAVDWLSDRLSEGGYTLSPKSDVTEAQVAAHRAYLAEPIRRI